MKPHIGVSMALGMLIGYEDGTVNGAGDRTGVGTRDGA